MTRWVFTIGACLSLLLAGCSLVATTARNVYNEPALALDECRFRHKTRHMAEDAWEQYRCSPETAQLSSDFRDGFLDGYTDYLRYGGSGAPNVVPPKRYQRVRYETPTGLRAVDAYFEGFQQGTQAAIASGQRHLLVVPVLVPVPHAADVPASNVLPPPNLGPPA